MISLDFSEFEADTVEVPTYVFLFFKSGTKIGMCYRSVVKLCLAITIYIPLVEPAVKYIQSALFQ